MQAGYLSRSRVEAAPSGPHRLLQARDVSRDEGISLDTAVLFHAERNPQLYRVSRGDILIIARGQDHHAHLIETDLVDTLASSVFHIIRPRDGMVLPGYLAWWLNQPDVQAEIKSGSRGTGIGYISRQTMEQVRVMVPPLGAQQRIADTMILWQRKRSLQLQLDEKRELMIQTICRKALRQDKESPHDSDGISKRD